MIGFCNRRWSHQEPLEDVEALRHRDLRRTIFGNGIEKFVSVICYLILFLLVYYNSSGKTSQLIQYFTLAAIFPQCLVGAVFCMGALKEHPLTLNFAMCLSFLMAAYNTGLGIFGVVYFIPKVHYTVHAIVTCIFACLSLSIISVVFNELFVIYAYKKLLINRRLQPTSETVDQLDTGPRITIISAVLSPPGTLNSA